MRRFNNIKLFGYFIMLLLVVLYLNVTDFVHSDSDIGKSNRLRRVYKNGVLRTTIIINYSGLPYKVIKHGWAEGEGVNKTYYEDGTLKAVYNFKGGRIVSYKKFNKKGGKIFESIIENQADRKDFEYDENGRFQRELDYEYYMPVNGNKK